MQGVEIELCVLNAVDSFRFLKTQNSVMSDSIHSECRAVLIRRILIHQSYALARSTYAPFTVYALGCSVSAPLRAAHFDPTVRPAAPRVPARAPRTRRHVHFVQRFSASLLHCFCVAEDHLLLGYVRWWPRRADCVE